ncbi:MAG: NAD(P)-binding domain-containing protein [Actinomycetota bacterium]|nr:NAD(P)-binding domain-containing protein [Actinomycetota bacterium]
MRFGVLGTGMVGQAIATKLLSIGHAVTMGSRQAGNDRAVAWAAGAGQDAAEGSFADAAAFGEVVFNATAGAASLAVLAGAGADNLAGKVLIDVANPLDMSAGMPPALTVCNTDSLGEQIQRAFPAVRVVKALNTVNADVMVEPGVVPASHTAFVSGDDPEAKAQVVELLASFGWGADDIMDLGDITSARGTEMYLALWLRLWGATGTGHFNVKVVTA